MSSNDSTRPDDDGRSVATDADNAVPSPPARDAESGSTVSGAEETNGRPSPVPRPAGSAGADTQARWEPTSGAEPVASPQAAGATDAAPSGTGSAAPGEGPPPWRRVPGEHPTVDEQPVDEDEFRRPTVADSLLSEAPTAFLAGPRAAPDGAASPQGTTAVADDPADTNGRPDGGLRPSARNRPPRQALLQLKRLDPWSVLKMALALAIVLFLIWMVAAGVLYGVLGGMGVWDRLNGTYADLVTGQTQESGSLISAGRVFLLAGVVGAINSLLFAVALTIGAFVYNVAADLVGGIEVTLSERD